MDLANDGVVAYTTILDRMRRDVQGGAGWAVRESGDSIRHCAGSLQKNDAVLRSTLREWGRYHFDTSVF